MRALTTLENSIQQTIGHLTVLGSIFLEPPQGDFS